MAHDFSCFLADFEEGVLNKGVKGQQVAQTWGVGAS